jgi:hypothetical protein
MDDKIVGYGVLVAAGFIAYLVLDPLAFYVVAALVTLMMAVKERIGHLEKGHVLLDGSRLKTLDGGTFQGAAEEEVSEVGEFVRDGGSFERF